VYDFVAYVPGEGTLPKKSRRTVLFLALVVAAGCGGGGKKASRSCSLDEDCSGGVCFEEQCFDACGKQGDCEYMVARFCESPSCGKDQRCVVEVRPDGAGCQPMPADFGTCQAGECVCGDGCLGDASWPPVVGSWRPISLEGAPAARKYVDGEWTGEEFCVWGGLDQDGKMLNDGGCLEISY
jgi:hypothetical protein